MPENQLINSLINPPSPCLPTHPVNSSPAQLSDMALEFVSHPALPHLLILQGFTIAFILKSYQALHHSSSISPLETSEL